jgi:hypothetical protein
MDNISPWLSLDNIDPRIKALSEASDAELLVNIDQQLEVRIEVLQERLRYRISQFPKAEKALKLQAKSWIQQARLDLWAYRNTGTLPLLPLEDLVALEKDRAHEELNLAAKFHPEMDIKAMKTAEDALFDAAYAEHQRSFEAHNIDIHVLD